MKPTYATQCLLRISDWCSQVHYCIQVAIEARRTTNPTNAEWWLERAKIHAVTMNLMRLEYKTAMRLHQEPAMP
jgi:hypothetical protein